MIDYSPGSALLTDLYQLSILQAYFKEGMRETAVFDLFVRKLPENRQFLMAAGLETALEYLESLAFTTEELQWMGETGLFSPDFLDHLREFRFTGDVEALPEGTLCFPDEPILRVTAPLLEAQLVESRLINLVNYQTMVASKAARMVLVKGESSLIDFGFRRAHGAEAGLLSARASYLAGFDSTATVLAGKLYGIPISGTMAHSYILSHLNETAAFEGFAHSQPNNVVLLIDTYDTVAAARKVVALAPRLKERDIAIQAVRLDSGDLGELAKQVRRVLDDGGLGSVKIYASGDLDEYEIRRLRESGAPIDGYGVGTRLTTSSDTPYLSMVYKLQEYGGQPRRKLSASKATWPGRKQIYRTYDREGRMAGDLLTLESDTDPDGTPLLKPAMRNGKRMEPSPPLDSVREHAAAELSRLPDALRDLNADFEYPVTLSPALKDLAEQAEALMKAHEGE